MVGLMSQRTILLALKCSFLLYNKDRGNKEVMPTNLELQGVIYKQQQKVQYVSNIVIDAFRQQKQKPAISAIHSLKCGNIKLNLKKS